MASNTPWKVLIVDDEPDVIAITEMVFDGLTFEGRLLEILTATSAAQARAVFESVPDVAVAYIDVVMETDHAGLDLVRYVRGDLGNATTRLILRTGNPGAAPRQDIVRHLAIDAYKEKVELTADRLETSLLTSLRTYSLLRGGPGG